MFVKKRRSLKLLSCAVRIHSFIALLFAETVGVDVALSKFCSVKALLFVDDLLGGRSLVSLDQIADDLSLER